ncbi:hypothetical protein BASA62_008870 [Batrachochytrium salamandrivorans]|nr:hypothetical protein BASA62_008870 [Batrachochytrium salamandrivorans]
MDQAIRIDNRIVERRQETAIRSSSIPAQSSTQPLCPSLQHQSVSSRDYNLPVRQTPLQPSAFSTPPSATQHRSTDDMDVDFARRGPLTPVERQRRMIQRLCLFAANRAILRPLAPSQTLDLNPQRHVQRLRWMTLTLRCRETTSADFKWRLRLGREKPDSEAPRGEMGSFTQMPPTSLLCSHQPAISTLNNFPNSDPNFSDPSTSIFALSSLRKLLLPGTLRIGPLSHVSTLFVDCGADDIFMDSKLAEELKVSLIKLQNPITLRLADGDSSSTLTHQTVPLQLHIGNHIETVSFYVTSLCHGLLLGYSWLERHNPRINWVSRMVDFDSSYCLENCSAGSTRTQGLGKPPIVDRILPLNSEPMDPQIQDVLDLENVPPGPVSTWTLDSIHSDVYPFLDASPDSNSSVPDDIFKEFTSVFSKKQSEKLPIHREFDCTIDLVPNAAPHHGKIYQLTREEDKVMQDWITENLAKGFIRNSSSPHGAPCFFVKQKDKLRLCMDYRGLNKNTIKDRNPIPLISEMLRTLSIGKVFTTLDLRGAYNLLRIKEGDEPKTAFITKYGQFEFLVMPFGLANAPAQFQRMMNTLFRDSIGKFVLVYLDDIVIYSENLEKHKDHVKSVLTILSKNGLYCKLESATSTSRKSAILGM